MATLLLSLQAPMAAVRRLKSPPLSRTPHLMGCPQARGVVRSTQRVAPKKPNSAQRHIAKVRLMNKPRVSARIEGSSLPPLKNARVYVRGGRANDLPGIGYTVMRRDKTGCVPLLPVRVGAIRLRRRSQYALTHPTRPPRKREDSHRKTARLRLALKLSAVKWRSPRCSLTQRVRPASTQPTKSRRPQWPRVQEALNGTA